MSGPSLEQFEAELKASLASRDEISPLDQLRIGSAVSAELGFYLVKRALPPVAVSLVKSSPSWTPKLNELQNRA